VLLHVTHSNLKARMFELRMDRHMTVGSVKEKLRAHAGTGSDFMHLTLLDDNNQAGGSSARLRASSPSSSPPPSATASDAALLRSSQVVADLVDDSLMLGYFSPMDGWTIHITDLDPHSLSAGGAHPAARRRMRPRPSAAAGTPRPSPRRPGGCVAGQKVRDLGGGLPEARQQLPAVEGGAEEEGPEARRRRRPA